MIEITVGVLYTCSVCGIKNAKVEVPARGSDEDVAHWVEQVMAYKLSRDHLLRSPFCRAKTMAEVKIPVTGSDRLGDPPRN